MSWIHKEIGWLKSKVIYEWLPGKAKRKRLFYKELIKAGDLCFDIGAHLGDRTATFMELGASVIAIEPQPRFFNYLKNKFRSHQNVQVLPVAVGDAQGKMKLHISNNHPTLSTLSGTQWRDEMNAVAPYEVEYDETIDVDVVTCDYLKEKFGCPKFIKIDVEGFELQVLKGLSTMPTYISIEFLSFDLKRLIECLDYLSQLGYQEFNWSYKETFTWVRDNWVSQKTLLQSIEGYENGIFSGDVYARKLESSL